MKRVRVIWAAAVAERLRAGRLWVLGLLAALVLLGLPLAAMGLSIWQQSQQPVMVWFVALIAGGTALWGGMAVLALAAWVGLVPNLLRQNHPSHARLVPGHANSLRRALQAGAALATLLSTVLPAALLLAMQAHVHMGTTMAAAVIVTVGALWPVMLTLAMRWPQLNLLWLVLPLIAAQSLPALAGGGQHLAQAYQQGGAPLWWGTALAVWGLAALLLRAVVLGGGPHHRRIHARVPRMDRVLVTQMSAEAAWSQWGVSNTRLLDLLSGRGLFRRRLQAGLDGRRTEPPALGLALAPDLQPLGVLSTRLPGLMLLLGAAAVMSAGDASAPWRQSLTPALLGAGAAHSFAALYFLRLHQAVLSSRGEQALLGLLPGAPRGAPLNRWFARQLAATAWAALAMSAAGGLGALALLTGTSGAWWSAGVSAVVVSACAIPWLWRDWSRAEPAQRQSQHHAGRPMLLMLAAMATNLVAGIAFPAELPWLWLAQLLAAAAWGLWCWRRMAHCPTAWPVGHARSRG
jgi:hypothetical protein